MLTSTRLHHAIFLYFIFSLFFGNKKPYQRKELRQNTQSNAQRVELGSTGREQTASSVDMLDCISLLVYEGSYHYEVEEPRDYLRLAGPPFFFVPYLLRPRLRSCTPPQSSAPRTMW